MRLLDKTWLTRDEEYCPERRLEELLAEELEKLKLDTYNGEYVVRVTVDKVDEKND